MPNRMRFRLTLLSGTVAAIWPALGWAQTAPARVKAGEEIVVTATKTGDPVEKVDGSITALTGTYLNKLGAQSSVDYLPFTPGVVFNGQKPGFSTISIRGVNTVTSPGINQGTTGVYLNDIPLTDPFFSAGTPDIDTFDVRDVQVYRGPQGTLFGSASLGGAVDYVAKPANLDHFETAGELTAGGTKGSEDANYAAKLMINAPLVAGRFAVRAVGIYRNDAGYIRNLGTGLNDAGGVETAGGRLLAEWRPASGTTLSLTTLYQVTRTNDAPYQDPAFGDLNKFTNVAEPSRASVFIYSLRLNQDVGFATLTAIASHHEKQGWYQSDLKRFSRFGFVSPSLIDVISSEGETIELRLASQVGLPLQWLVGAMYDRTTETVEEDAYAPNAGATADALVGPGSAATLTVGNRWGQTIDHFTGKEAAFFGEVSYLLADKLKVTVGGRLYDIKSQDENRGSGLLYKVFVNGQAVNAPPTGSQNSSGFSPKVSISYDIASSVRVYALASKGFRFGGNNVNPDPSLPRAFGPDSLWNYEAGIKGQLFGKRLTLDISAFKIDWSNIQLTVTTTQGTSGIVNAGDARIYGAEASADWTIIPGLQLNSNVTYIDAVLNQVNSATGLVFPITAGSRLPGASKWMTSHVLRYQWGEKYRPFISASYRYASLAPALLQRYPLQNPTVGDYALFAIRAGVSLGRADIVGFVDNLTDRRAILSSRYTGNLGNTVNNYIVRPRTFGISLDWKY